MNYYQLLSLERPRGLVGEPTRCEEMSYILPRKAQEQGMMLLDIFYRQPEYPRDPVIIFNKEGEILHVWSDDYTPGYFEVKRVCEKLLKDN